MRWPREAAASLVVVRRRPVEATTAMLVGGLLAGPRWPALVPVLAVVGLGLGGLRRMLGVALAAAMLGGVALADARLERLDRSALGHEHLAAVLDLGGEVQAGELGAARGPAGALDGVDHAGAGIELVHAGTVDPPGDVDDEPSGRTRGRAGRARRHHAGRGRRRRRHGRRRRLRDLDGLG